MNIFTKHPASVGETYFEHFKVAVMTGSMMIIGGIACVIHGFFPFLFERTGSDKLINLLYRHIERMPTLDDRLKKLYFLLQKKNIKKKKVQIEELA